MTTVQGRSAAGWDLLRRLALMAALLVLLVVAVLAVIRALSVPVLIVAGVLLLAALIAWWVCGARMSATVRAEREAGYSTIFDFEGYELRDPRTLEVLRERDVAPTGIRRSLVVGMLGIKPGTVVARQLKAEQLKDDRLNDDR